MKNSWDTPMQRLWPHALRLGDRRRPESNSQLTYRCLRRYHLKCDPSPDGLGRRIGQWTTSIAGGC